MKPGWYVAGVARARSGSGWFLAPKLGRRLAFFDVRNVEVVGARFVPMSTIVGALKLPASASIFDPLGPVASRVRKLPGIKGVEIEPPAPGHAGGAGHGSGAGGARDHEGRAPHGG